MYSPMTAGDQLYSLLYISPTLKGWDPGIVFSLSLHGKLPIPALVISVCLVKYSSAVYKCVPTESPRLQDSHKLCHLLWAFVLVEGYFITELSACRLLKNTCGYFSVSLDCLYCGISEFVLCVLAHTKINAKHLKEHLQDMNTAPHKHWWRGRPRRRKILMVLLFW